MSTTVESVVRACSTASPSFVNPENKSQVVKSLARGLRLKRSKTLTKAIKTARHLRNKNLSPRRRRRNVIRLLCAGNEKIRRLKAEDLVDDSVVRRLEKDGRF